jgi:hypothetical protein
VISAHRFGNSIHLAADKTGADAAFVVESLRASGFDDARVEVQLPGMEDCFIDLMQKINT